MLFLETHEVLTNFYMVYACVTKILSLLGTHTVAP